MFSLYNNEYASLVGSCFTRQMFVVSVDSDYNKLINVTCSWTEADNKSKTELQRASALPCDKCELTPTTNNILIPASLPIVRVYAFTHIMRM